MWWWNDLVLITRGVKEQITVQGAGPLLCAIGIFFWGERFSLKGACLNPWESLKWRWSWRRRAPRHPSASVPGRLWSAHPSVFCFKELMLCQESWDVLVCIQECFHWLLSPLLVAQWVAGRIKAQYLSEPSLLSLIIQQVLKCLVSVSVWSASLAALPVISVTGLNSHQACALLLVTNAQCIFLIGYCSLHWFRPERSQRKELRGFLVRPCWVQMKSRGI